MGRECTSVPTDESGLVPCVSRVDKDQNPETQLRILREHAEARGWTLTGEYVDHASAADLRGRVAWREVWGDAERTREGMARAAAEGKPVGKRGPDKKPRRRRCAA